MNDYGSSPQKKNSAVFDLQSTNVTIDAFLAALSTQYPEAIRGVDTQQGAARELS